MADRISMFEDLSEIAQRRRELTIEEGLSCERCGTTSGVFRGPRGCAYPYEGKIGDKDDPNYAILCNLCWIEERQYWQELWDEYYAGRL